ncbi:HPr family phosphocarrier protein [Lachnospiraceae bacterium MD1]|jgi:phosphocarrier protein HPr|uniref:HPr family phosphocarrier protein n=1 Tax=Variimorphobacter saccharofermentans TaxID=2755051 RepID=A0A839JXG5_9FIRM|nr:HPr family phosphocarrier protein [Variimorphobacter saccharofermentans]MBB2181917.1 HPr family phosphocarrier protein [Variimorphobacter saccharofermentans]
MVSRKIMVNIPAGLHLRPISVLCNRSIDFQSSIKLIIGDKSVNAKSVIGVLSACVKEGDEIELICEGPDEEEALEVLTDMIKGGLGDEFIKK